MGCHMSGKMYDVEQHAEAKTSIPIIALSSQTNFEERTLATRGTDGGRRSLLGSERTSEKSLLHGGVEENHPESGGGFSNATNTESIASHSGKADPLVFLHEVCMLQVLEFIGIGTQGNDTTMHASHTVIQSKLLHKSRSNCNLVHGDEQNGGNRGSGNLCGKQAGMFMFTLKEVGCFYNSLACVSKGWKRLVDRFISLPSFCIEVDFDKMGRKRQSAFLWLYRRKVNIGALIYTKYTITSWLPLLVALMLECNTRQLTYVRIGMFPSLSADAQVYSKITSLHQRFHGLLAMRCPNLKSFQLSVSAKALQLWALSTRTLNSLQALEDPAFGKSVPRKRYPGFSPMLLLPHISISIQLPVPVAQPMHPYNDVEFLLKALSSLERAVTYEGWTFQGWRLL